MGDRIISWKKWTLAFFSARWTEYNRRPGPSYTHRRRTKTVKKFLDGRGLVLDVGSGDGKMLTELLSEGSYTAVGLDLSKSLVEATRDLTRERNLADRIHMVQGDAEKLPFRDGCFDTVFSTGTIEHLPNPARGIAEMGRVAKHVKQLIIVTPNTVHGIVEKLCARAFHSTITSKFLVNELRRNRFRVTYVDCFLLLVPFWPTFLNEANIHLHFLLEKLEQELPRILRMIFLADIVVVGVKNA